MWVVVRPLFTSKPLRHQLPSGQTMGSTWFCLQLRTHLAHGKREFMLFYFALFLVFRVIALACIWLFAISAKNIANAHLCQLPLLGDPPCSRTWTQAAVAAGLSPRHHTHGVDRQQYLLNEKEKNDFRYYTLRRFQ